MRLLSCFKAMFLPGVVAALVLGAVVACGRRPPEPAGGRPVIVASIYPVASLSAMLFGEWADIRTLLPAGQSPHDFDPSPAQQRLLADADVFLIVGGGLDPWAESLAAQHPDVKVMRMIDLVGLDADAVHKADSEAESHDGHDHADHAHDHAGAINPHVWLHPEQAYIFLEHLAVELGPMFPDRSLAARMHIAKKNVLNVAQLAKNDVAVLPNKRMVTFHNAFDPLADHCGLEVVAHLVPIEQAPGGQVSPAQLKRVIDIVRRYDLAVIYTEPQMDPTAMRVIQAETGVALLVLDPLGGPDVPGYENYVSMMTSNISTLRRGQQMSRTAEASR